MFRWQLDDARNFLARAREANPSDTMVLHYSAMLHAMSDEYDASIAAARRALEVDPRNPAPYSPLAFSLRAKGDQAAAAEAARKMIEIAPTAAIGYVVLARTQTQGDAAALQEGREALRIAEPFLKDVLAFRVDAALSHARMGSRADAERLVRSFQDATQGRHIDPGLQAMLHMALGEHARAYERVRYALSHRHLAMDPYPLLLIRHNTWSDPILERQEWQALREQLAYKPLNARPTTAR
jgi:tetratricopeptide (TPR) repeat protein